MNLLGTLVSRRLLLIAMLSSNRGVYSSASPGVEFRTIPAGCRKTFSNGTCLLAFLLTLLPGKTLRTASCTLCSLDSLGASSGSGGGSLNMSSCLCLVCAAGLFLLVGTTYNGGSPSPSSSLPSLLSSEISSGSCSGSVISGPLYFFKYDYYLIS